MYGSGGNTGSIYYLLKYFGLEGAIAIVALFLVVAGAGQVWLQKERQHYKPYFAHVSDSKNDYDRRGRRDYTSVQFKYTDDKGEHQGSMIFAHSVLSPHPEWGSDDKWPTYWHPGRSFVVFTDPNNDQYWSRSYSLDQNPSSAAVNELYVGGFAFVLAMVLVMRKMLNSDVN